MDKKQKLRYCNLGLVVTIVPTLATSLLLEFGHGHGVIGMNYRTSIALHLIFATVMLALITYHLYLHFGKSGWKDKVKRLKNLDARWLVILGAAVGISGALALVCLIYDGIHTPLGGWHGKIGLAMLALSVSCFQTKIILYQITLC